MILPIPKNTLARIATTPYDISYYEPMHQWEIKKKFAIVPHVLWEYEDSTSVIHSMVPDDYRVFIRTNKVVWLDYYYEMKAYTRSNINPVRGRLNKKCFFAVDEYYYMQKLL